jgi:hypothetical protein
VDFSSVDAPAEQLTTSAKEGCLLFLLRFSPAITVDVLERLVFASLQWH